MESKTSVRRAASARALVTGISIAILLFCGAAALIGEQGETAASGTSSSACVSGMKWTGGDRESPEMHPGTNCIGCHTAKGDNGAPGRVIVPGA